MITIKHKGSFRHIEKYLKNAPKKDYFQILNEFGRRGVDALKAATPRESGKTAESWRYRIEKTGTGYAIYWENTNTNRGVNIAVLIQYGHGTGTGGYVQGIDYINPALKEPFKQLADQLWEEVKRS